MSRLEPAYRDLKAVDLAVRPISHRIGDRVRGQAFPCLLACCVQWHLARSSAPLLFRDEERPLTSDPVAPGQHSEAALVSACTQWLPDSMSVRSLRSRRAELATLSRNRVVPAYD